MHPMAVVDETTAPHRAYSNLLGEPYSKRFVLRSAAWDLPRNAKQQAGDIRGRSPNVLSTRLAL